MTQGALSRRVEGIGERSIAGTLSKLLQLTSEAVLVFDGSGRVLLANEEAERLFSSPTGVVGSDVRLFFSASGESAPSGELADGSLPFPLDGIPGLTTCLTPSGRQLKLRVRCDRVHAPGETYLLLAIPAERDELVGHEAERTLLDLRRANHRLSGTLNIILDTMDADDLQALFGRVLEEISDTMEADGTLVYLAEADGFRLRGVSSSLLGDKLARFMPFGRSIERVAVRDGHTVRLRVAAPDGDALRQGRLTSRDVVNEETHEVLRVKSTFLPPFTSFMVVPVWFGGNVIAIIEVGWRRVHPLFKDDAGLLDSVAHYLSVQLASAFTALRSQRSDHLAALETELREELLAAVTEKGDEGVLTCMEDVLCTVATALEADVAPLRATQVSGMFTVDLPVMGPRALSLDVDALVSPHLIDGVAVVPVAPESGLSAALRELGVPCVGALLDFGELADSPHRVLLLRADGSEPLDELETEFLLDLVADVHDIARGQEEREQDKRIAQALQMGMRNELQQVDGITAEAVYSSATESALVGGDFYDLIRLPGQRACVIMGDVSGKGVEAASVSAAVKTALAAYAWEGLAPARMVRSLNEFLLGFSRLETFATLFVGIVDLAEGSIRYCSAGHPPALLVRAGAGETSILGVQSGVVGAFHDIAYQDGVERLSAGDVLLLYTDGTTEARAANGDFFGEDGLREAVMRESAGEKPFEGFVGRLLETLEAFTGHNLEDDVAMLALRIDRVGAGEKRDA